MNNEIENSKINILIKIASLILIVVSIYINGFDFFVGASVYLYLFIMFIENTILISSVSPLAVLSIPLAANLLNESNYVVLSLGYIAALAGNALSYIFGKMMSKSASSSSPEIKKMVLTYWHPQLAALTAFDAGTANVPAIGFFTRSVLVSISYYAAALLLINSTKGEITQIVSSDIFMVGAVALWLGWDLLIWFRRSKAF